MSEYDLRSAFPMNGKVFQVRGTRWRCELAEVSDSRPAADRLSWYLVFEEQEEGNPSKNQPLGLRKLEVVTTADHLLENGWADDLEERLVEWLLSGEQDGRQEWLDK